MTPLWLLQEVMDKYELNDFRVAVLTKLQGKLHDNLVDQVSSDWSLEYCPLIGPHSCRCCTT